MLEYEKVPGMLEITSVQADSTLDEVRESCEIANQVRAAVVFSLPCFFTKIRDELLAPDSGVVIGGGAGFPSGGCTTFMKRVETKEALSYGCGEIDMTCNTGALKSGLYDMYLEDIQAVVEAADGHPVKAIIECSLLTPDEIKRASELCVKGGVNYIKTNTGWGPRPTSIEDVRLIKSTIGDDAKIKAAGGIRNLATLEAMYNEGATRFGVGVRSVKKILAEIEKLKTEN